MADRRIYAIAHPQDDLGVLSYYKIGIAVDVAERMKVLQSGTPFELDLVTTIEPDGSAREVEEAIHRALFDRTVRGEWFDISKNTVAALKYCEPLSAETVRQARKRVSELSRKGEYQSFAEVLPAI